MEDISQRFSRTLLDNTVRDAEEMRQNPSQFSAALRATCDVELNARDVYGDGDQSFLSDAQGSGVGGQSQGQPLRDTWSAGADIEEQLNSGGLSKFWMACFTARGGK